MIVVINLPNRTDRRRDMERQLSRIGWSAEFFPAIRPTDAGGFASIGARGCFLSHLEVLRRASDAKVERLVLLEDDLNFSRDLQSLWPLAVGSLATMDWSIFYAGHAPQGGLRLCRLASDDAVMRTHFMVFNGAAIGMLIAGLEVILSRPAGHPLGGPMHVDGAYSTLRRQNPGIVSFAHCPALGTQRPSRTDVGPLRWFDRVSGLDRAATAARRVKVALTQRKASA